MWRKVRWFLLLDVRYAWRRWLGWVPFQTCMVCGRWYWGGLPRWWWTGQRWTATWQASWMDYCSRKCCDEDPSVNP